MNLDLTAYITLICTSGVLNLYLCFYVFIKRHHYANIAHLFFIRDSPPFIVLVRHLAYYPLTSWK
ncbi:hypothetical protein P4678_04375 [Priestia megaterium]|uniref:hypothetical protein n=1 Tax=Priestia megaterium TaxID=1404 RepID=UPI002E1BFCA6|nr:hypothetical protein [Priestia megaterium]MED4293869.1 hypothetical protein [Priestia megaterium]